MEWFERISILLILINSITLGLADPCDQNCEKPLCAPLEIAEHAIFTFFFVEMLIKMLAMGVYGPKSYLSEGWNRFDCFIVLIGITEYVFADGVDINLSAIRAFRVLRPLRAINRISSLRLLATLILDILPMISNVMILYVFIFVFFGIVSVQLWAGLLRQRCFFPDNNIIKTTSVVEPPDFMPKFYKVEDEDYICSPIFGMRTCQQIPFFEVHKSMCAELFANDKEKLATCKKWVGNYTECRADGDNPGYGTTNFDNIGYASIAIFQVISLEGWSDIMYYVQDAFSFWSFIYFILLVLLGSYFAVKLCLVVIAAQFSVTRQREKERRQQERITEAARLGKSLSSISVSSSISDDTGLYVQVIDLITYLFRYWILKKICRVKLKMEQVNLLAVSLSRQQHTCPKCNKPSSTSSELCPTCRANEQGSLKDLINTNRAYIRRIADNDKTQAIVASLIILNAIVMASEHYRQPAELTNFIEIANRVFTVIFVLELVLRFYAFGPGAFSREAFNVLDTFIIILNLVEMFNSRQQNNGSGISVLRLFRLFRLVKILRFFPALQKQILLMMHTVDNVTSFFVLLGFIMYVSALLGRNLFGCKFCQQPPPPPPPSSSVADDDEEPKLARHLFENSAITLNVSIVGQKCNTNCCYAILPIAKDPLHIKYANVTSISKEMRNSDSNDDDDHHDCTEANFDTLFHAIFTVLQIFTRDDFGTIMQDGMRYTTVWASVFFVILVTIGDYILFNLLVGILVEGFSNKQERELEKHLLRAAELNGDKKGGAAMPAMWRLGVFSPNVAFSNFSKAFSPASTGKSLFLFANNSPFRRKVQRMVANPIYDGVFIVVTIASCVVIALERGSIDPSSQERRLIDITGYSISFIFLLEAMAKVIALGFLRYIVSPGNALDFGLLVLAGIDLAFEVFGGLLGSHVVNKSIIHILRPIRLLRALRPLRLISRARGLRIVLQTLTLSIKPLTHIILVCCFFFAIFAILGVQLFSGCYARCVAPKQTLHIHYNSDDPASILPIKQSSNVTRHTDDEIESFLAKVKTRDDCISFGLEWETEPYNFNSLPSALMALFVFATLDGWTDITRNGANCIGADIMPSHSDNPWSYVYFISFLFVVCFFALNMFVGVVVNNFQKVNEKMAVEIAVKGKVVRTEALLRRLSTRFLPCTFTNGDGLSCCCGRVTTNNRKSSVNANGEFWLTYPKWRLYLYRLMVNPKFEYAVMSAVAINVLSMAIEYHRMPKLLDQVIGVAGYAFMGLLTLEMICKMIAFGFGRYIKDRFNKLDFVITVSSLAGILLEIFGSDLLPLNPSIVRIARVFRILRIVKLWRAATNLRALLDTVAVAIPQVFNLSILFVLLFFIYASLGVQLYGRFDCVFDKCEGLSRHANFQHFGMAILTLFRIFTGDNWNLILKDVLHMSKDGPKCDEWEKTNQGISCSVIRTVAPIYFISFVLLAQFILINIVVAVLMEQIANIHKAAVADDEKSVDKERKDIIAKVEALEEEALFVITNTQERLPLPRIEGFDALELISIVSTDYVIRQEICDAVYLADKLRRAAQGSEEDLRTIAADGSCILGPSPSIVSATPSMMMNRHVMISSISELTLTVSPSPRQQQQQQQQQPSPTTIPRNYDSQLWQKVALDIQKEFRQQQHATCDVRNHALTNYMERRRRRLSQASSIVTWLGADQSPPLTSPCISEKLLECASSQFDTSG